MYLAPLGVVRSCVKDVAMFEMMIQGLLVFAVLGVEYVGMITAWLGLNAPFS